MIDLYGKRGMVVINVHGDGEFDSDKVRNMIRPANLHICAPEEHVGIAERGIRTVKERTRTMIQSLEYRRYPRVMVRSLVEYMGYLLNRFPSSNGVSDDESPAEIVLGVAKIDIGAKHIQWGDMRKHGSKPRIKRRIQWWKDLYTPLQCTHLMKRVVLTL